MEKGNKCYFVQWTEYIGYYTYVYAKNKKEAKELFMQGVIDGIEPDGYCETIDESIIVDEVSP